MDTALWVVQILLALAFGMAGFGKLAQTKEALQPRMAFVEDFSQNTIRIIGALEVAAAIGLILPMLLDILPVLTPLAAIGLILTMLGAAYTHYRRKEFPMIGMNFVLLALAAFVAYGRLAIESAAVV